jgi:hypothetical protein
LHISKRIIEANTGSIETKDNEVGAANILKEKKINMITIEYHSLNNYDLIKKNILKESGYYIFYSSKHMSSIHKDSKYVNEHIIAKLRVLEMMMITAKS